MVEFHLMAFIKDTIRENLLYHDVNKKSRTNNPLSRPAPHHLKICESHKVFLNALGDAVSLRSDPDGAYLLDKTSNLG